MTAGPLYEQMPPSISRILGAGVSMCVVMSRTISCSRAYASIQKDDRVAITKNPAAAYAPIRTPKVRRRQAGRRTTAGGRDLNRPIGEEDGIAEYEGRHANQDEGDRPAWREAVDDGFHVQENAGAERKCERRQPDVRVLLLQRPDNLRQPEQITDIVPLERRPKIQAVVAGPEVSPKRPAGDRPDERHHPLRRVKARSRPGFEHADRDKHDRVHSRKPQPQTRGSDTSSAAVFLRP